MLLFIHASIVSQIDIMSSSGKVICKDELTVIKKYRIITQQRQAMKCVPDVVGLRPLLKINIRHIIIVGWVEGRNPT
jgi:hypothetical protein